MVNGPALVVGGKQMWDTNRKIAEKPSSPVGLHTNVKLVEKKDDDDTFEGILRQHRAFDCDGSITGAYADDPHLARTKTDAAYAGRRQSAFATARDELSRREFTTVRDWYNRYDRDHA